MKFATGTLVAAAILGFVAPAPAALVTITPSLTGFTAYDSTGRTGIPDYTFTYSFTNPKPDDLIYDQVGSNGGWLCRNFFDFSIPELGGTVVSATLTLDNGGQAGDGVGHWSDPWYEPHPFTVYGRGASYAYGDIGTGPVYGYSPIGSRGTVSISLNGSALSAIESAQGDSFRMGGRGIEVASIWWYVYDFGGLNHCATLTLDVVPEPATLLIWSGLGLLAIVGVARRRTSA